MSLMVNALAYVGSKLDPKRKFLSEDEQVLYRTLAQILGLRPDFKYNHDRSMQVRSVEDGVLRTNPITGGRVPLAAGAAMANKMAGIGDNAIACYSDTTVNIASALARMNFAALGHYR
jgi:2-oxoisovalerate dehydrogenase E1 component